MKHLLTIAIVLVAVCWGRAADTADVLDGGTRGGVAPFGKLAFTRAPTSDAAPSPSPVGGEIVEGEKDETDPEESAGARLPGVRLVERGRRPRARTALMREDGLEFSRPAGHVAPLRC